MKLEIDKSNGNKFERKCLWTFLNRNSENSLLVIDQRLIFMGTIWFFKDIEKKFMKTVSIQPDKKT